MALLEILQFPHPVLRQRADEVREIDATIHRLARDMAETMHRAPGIGLAAPQVGVSSRLIVVDLSAGEEPDQLLVLVNPEIVCKEGKIRMEEGCLSVPDLRETVTRCERVVVRGQDLQGNMVEVEGDELMAVALQHEIDHLDGMLFIDHLSQLKRSRYVARQKKVAAEQRG
ncbi:MAG: peptide deformylase [Deferrisomatales bacterium]|nr:peptide deformylase [Deferrisomatales bacterium]HSH70993.1 peptide deformylase [Deferrisomatales bacterium]